MGMVNSETKKIAIIGVGNMGQAFALGLLRKKGIYEAKVILSNPSLDNLDRFRQLGAVLTTDNKEAVSKAEIVVLAVKPQVIIQVLQKISGVISHKQVIVSVAAAITIKTIKRHLGKEIPVVRVMPNLGAKVGESLSCWVKSREVTKSHQNNIKEMLQTIGEDIYLENEEYLDLVTAVSGSGPAYVFYFVEALIEAAIGLGFHKKQARKLVYQTLKGSTKLLFISNQSPQRLRQAVTSKRGTTEAAIHTLKEREFKKALKKAVQAASHRAQELTLS